MALTLTLTDVALLRDILLFVEKSQGFKHQQTTSRLKTFKRLQDQVDGAYAHFYAPSIKELKEQRNADHA